MLDKQTVTTHSNGLNKDGARLDRNDVSFALNATRINHEGGRAEYQSEPGNELAASLPSGYLLIGTIYGQDEETYLFSTNNSSSEIGIFKQDRYTTLANLDLNFSTKYPITGEYRVRNGCERCIYWGDETNPDYWFNIDKPNDFKTSNVFDPNKFKFVPSIQCPKIDLVQVNSSGGNLPLGSYYFQLEIVDSDGNSFYRTDITPQTIIYDDDQTDSYNNIDGGLNAPQYDPAIGGLPSTNKSITLRFHNLDTSFTYLKVNVVRQITNTGVVDAHTIGQLIPISNEELTWTYTGYDVNVGDSPVDYSSLIIPNVRYKSSYVQEQVQGRYVRANVKQDQVDYSTYQSYASLITAEWVAKEVEVRDQFALGNPKNPSTYWYCTTFQGDEVAAFGIQYLLTNGEVSPVFPLIGRAPTSTDLDTITVVSNATASPTSTQVWLSDVEHLGYTVGQTLPRWKAFNTASITTSNTTTHPYDYIGEFGYYESDSTTYPNIQKCDSDLIWGEDGLGNPIDTNTKLRYFRFPDRRLVPHITGTNGEYIQPLGVKFDNITYPSSDVVGHRFCRAVRSTGDKTVIDSGWAVQPIPVVTGAGDRLYMDANFADINNATTDGYARYNSANVFYNESIFNPDYIKTNHAYHIESSLDSEETIVNKTASDTITAYSYTFTVTEKSVPTRTNYLVEDQVFVPARSYTSASVFSFPIQSADHAAGDNILKLGTYSLENASTLLSANVLGGANITDPVTGTLEYNMYYTYKKVIASPYESILNLNYNYLSFNFSEIADSQEFYNGDSLISLNSVTRMFWPLFTPDNILQGLCYNTMYEEHEFNTSLRHGGQDSISKYYHAGSDISILLEKVATLGSDGYYTLIPNNEVIPEYFSYNKDYNVQSVEQGKVSLLLNFDYCSDCLNEYPNRIIWSPKSFEEESFDLYRINKINDYLDLPAHRGRITGLKYQNNQLLVHTEDTTFILQPNPQQIATDQNTAYLTTGDFLSIPPQELLQIDVGVAGLQSKQSQCDTPFGHFWTDQKRGEVFGWNGQLETISNKGLQQWFKEYLPSDLIKNFYQINLEDWPVQSTLDRVGTGVIMYYDPRFKRLLITKRDYLPIDHRQEFDSLDLNTAVWSHAESQWYSIPSGTTPVIVYPDNSLVFEDKSWTLSYSFLDKSFTSWHSYIPRIVFSDSNNFYTSAFNSSTNGIFKHLSYGMYQTYYGSKYDFIIEWTYFDPVSASVSSLYYVGYTHLWDEDSSTFKNVDSTFNKMLVYNNEQSTGLQTLVLQNQHSSPYQNVSLSSGSKHVIKTDQNYKISGIYDMSIGTPIMTKTWSLKKLNSGYIDHVVNTTNINLNKSVYDWGNIIDKQSYVRLFFNPVQDYRKSIILQVNNSEQSVR